MLITEEQLIAIMPYAKQRAQSFIVPLNNAMALYKIDTPLRIAAFLATIAVESGELRYTEEIASGDQYEMRKDLGNVKVGDGRRYKGRSLIQITGRANYQKYQDATGYNVIDNPLLLKEPLMACHCAAWWWFTHGLNALADNKDFLKISTKVNGKNKDGLPNGWVDRQMYYERVKRVLKC